MVSETVTLEGHIIDSNLLADVLDDIHSFGAQFDLSELHVGKSRSDRSHALIEVRTPDRTQMDRLLARLGRRGVLWRTADDAALETADIDGAFPEDFYATTNQRTLVRHAGQWLDVQNQEMDCGIRLEADGVFRCVPMAHVRRGDRIVRGQSGVKVLPLERRDASAAVAFHFPGVSTEKPKRAMIRRCAELILQAQREKKRVLLVAGPAIVHTGASRHVVELIERRMIDLLFAGNALAAHDIENAFYGTSLGVYVEKATLADAGNEHHLRAINRIRRSGGIANAVRDGTLTGGIMHACVQHGVPFVLAGSVRDDGPLPEVLTDVIEAQDAMRAALQNVGLAILAATSLHSIATNNLLPARVPAVCVDIAPGILGHLAGRGPFQTLGIVTDVEAFFRALLSSLDEIQAETSA